MPRVRSKLTDKQERILVQAQLMGLTPRDMQQIGNRLIALQKEAEFKSEVAEATAQFSWEPVIDVTRKSEKAWKITTPDGYLLEAFRRDKGRSSWDSYNWTYDIKVSKPGTRMKPRDLKSKSFYIPYDWKKSLMPAQDKELYAIIKWARDVKYEV